MSTPRDRPSLGGGEVPPPAAPPFASEPRDPARASSREQEIRTRVDRVIGELGAAGVVRLESVDCRTHRCQLVVAGDGAAFDQVLAAFQDDRGFLGWARELMLQDLQRDGAHARVTVQLDF